MIIWTYLLLMSLAGGCLLAARNLVHFFQLESYQFPGFFRTLKRKWAAALLPGFFMFLLWVGATVLFGNLFQGKLLFLNYLLESLILLAGGWGVRCAMMGKAGNRKPRFAVNSKWLGKLFQKGNPPKKPLNFTPRVKRLYVVAFLLFSVLLILFVSLGAQGQDAGEASKMLLLCLFFPLLLPLWFSLAGLMAWPIEKGISELYFRDAQRILRERKDLICIGITGSWGKTSVKFILGTLLNEKYPTLVTPASFNTPMGVTKVIRSKLTPAHRVFVAEMGARHVGDIKEMCRLVHPAMGLITSVGPQHLDTFHTVERVAKTKYELMDAIPADGCCFFADDEGIVRGLYQKTAKEKWLTGLDASADDVWAEELTVSAQGSRFMLCTREAKIPCETKLLGELNIRNILLCAAVCLKLGLSEREIARGIRCLESVEHRLQLIHNPGGITVIDDAFNSNIKGAKQAFEVLHCMTGGKRIVVTPGMVELGDQERKMNHEFGRAMCGNCDLALLVGKKRSEAIREGLAEGGFAMEKVLVVASLSEATECLKQLAVPGDTILFENDLPDNYSEA